MGGQAGWLRRAEKVGYIPKSFWRRCVLPPKPIELVHPTNSIRFIQRLLISDSRCLAEKCHEPLGTGATDQEVHKG